LQLPGATFKEAIEVRCLPDQERARGRAPL